SHEDDSNSDDEPDVLIIHFTSTPVVPIVDEIKTQNNGTKFDHATTNADNLDELTELQALQRQEQSGKEEADQFRLAFPSLNLILGVGSTPIGSSIFADIHGGLKIFDCPKSGIFTYSSYDEDFSSPDANNLENSLNVSSTITKRIHNIYPTSQVLGDIISPAQTRSQALADPDWVEAMQAEMQQFRNQKVWVLVTLPDGKRAIGTKWILKNKRDARRIVCRNKARQSVSAGRLTGSAGRPVSAGRPSGFADRTPIFDCLKSGIFTSFSYDEEFSGLDANNLEISLDVSTTITKRIHNIHPTSQVWVLVTLPDGKRAIETKWILKNKRDARGIVCRNKARLV
nr:hypothetical protein [Tanacetum cinerariifolium]